MQVPWDLRRVREENVFTGNLGQNNVDKFTKVSNIGFCMEYFTADFSQFCRTTVKNCLLSCQLKNFTSVPSFPRFSLKFPNFLRS